MANEQSQHMVLTDGEFAHVLGQTNGAIEVLRGPIKQSLADTDVPVVFNAITRRFDRVSLQQSIQALISAVEGEYVVLQNPSADARRPAAGKRGEKTDLATGTKINMPGPTSFALWPGEVATVIPGHLLRSNQYLVVQVYDEKAAKANWTTAVAKRPASAEGSSPEPSVDDITMGRQVVIKGTDVSFYIPPTGVEVLRDKEGKMTRDAVTLERLEYCVLSDEDGNKRIVRGPAVVFPEPTEEFVSRPVEGSDKPARKFRAYELTDVTGLHLKVIAPFKEGDVEHKEGEELFITGQDTKIYYPREEVAIIKYEGRQIHHAIAIPRGEARYVMDRKSGDIRLERGPCMFLPDPRKDVIVLRIVEPRLIELMYPGNSEALEINRTRIAKLRAEREPVAVAAAAALDVFASSQLESGNAAYGTSALVADAPRMRGHHGPVAKGFGGDAFDRRSEPAKPRTITIENKYEGAVTQKIHPGYAVLLVRADGSRRVAKGPVTVLLEYDEGPQILSLSSGTPKSDRAPIRTVYLKVSANKVSDEIDVETRDYCKLKIRVSYRISFLEDQEDKWFSVEDYTGFLADNMRSRIQRAVKDLTVEQFYQKSTDVIRNTVLGAVPDGGKRPGTTFEENGMHVYDCDVLQIFMSDRAIEGQLIDAARSGFQNNLEIERQKQAHALTMATAVIERERAQTAAETEKHRTDLAKESSLRTTELELLKIENGIKVEAERRKAKETGAAFDREQATLDLAQEKAQGEQEIALEAARQEAAIRTLAAEVSAAREKAAAFSPDLIAALTVLGDKAVVEKVASASSPLAILGGESLADVLSRILAGTKYADIIKTATKPAGNGAAPLHQ